MQYYYTMFDLQGVREFLLSGRPPIIVQLLLFNTIAMIITIIRRARGVHKKQRHVTFVLQWIFTFAVVAILIQDQWMPNANSMWYNVHDHVSNMLRQ